MNLSREFSGSREGSCERIGSGSIHQAVFFIACLLISTLLLCLESSAQTTQTYTAGSSTFTVPVGVTTITVEVWGGGGGGGNSNNTTGNGGAGGGGGAYARKVLTGLIPGTIYTVTVGTGGTGGPASSTTNATNGGDSQFAGSGITTIVAGGGKLGDGSGENTNGTGGNNTGGNGGTATGGDVNRSGGDGGDSSNNGGGGGGSSGGTNNNGNDGSDHSGNNNVAGGAAVTGGGAGGQGKGNSTGGDNGGSGTAPGGGGGGSNDVTTGAGGNGADGQIVVSYYECALGTQTDSGTNSWIGHVYDGANNFASASYLGRLTETQNFDESFGGDNVNFPLGTSCQVNTETFSVRFLMTLTISAANCGLYPITIGGDDGVRLTIDGTLVMNTLYSDHAYTEATQAIYLSTGTHTFVFDYYENQTNNRVSFKMGVNGGLVTGDQTLCGATVDPAAFTSITAAGNCSNGANSPAYQWQSSPIADFSASVTNIPGATSAAYDPPSQAAAGTVYYRRRATFTTPATTLYSNSITVNMDAPAGDQTTAGTNTWIGYVYDGAQNFTTNYLGSVTESQTFNETFCGADCIQLTSGCRFQTETFTVRYRMTFNPATSGNYTFTIGGDDGVRLSVNGTTVINGWADQGYTQYSSTAAVFNAGTNYNLILEYYENGGDNRVSFSFTSTPLPVTWSFLDGHYTEGNNIVEWKTASEKNNSGFVIERSMNGTAFDSIGFVAGNGTSLTPHSYQFIDASPGLGWNYYRLKQIDFDRAFEYSKIIPVYADSGKKPNIYPNPASSSLYISHSGTHPASDAYLSNATTGQTIPLVRDEKQPARYALDGVSTGTYIVSFTIDGRRYNEKVVVVK